MEFPSLIDTRSYIEDKLTPAGGADGVLISAEDTRKATAGLQEFITERGIIVKPSTAAFATISGSESKIVFIEGKGLFNWAATGAANGTTIFGAAGGGVFVRILKAAGPEEIQFAANGTYGLAPKATLVAVCVLPASTILFKLGTSPGADDLVPEISIDNTGEIRSVLFWRPVATTLYLSGITAATSISFITL